jgi:hypothetical protein
MLTLIFASALHYRQAAAEQTDWTETKSQENVLVQACGLYNIVSSYTADLDHHLITENTGDEISEQLKVEFAGSLGNPASGKSYQYDGHFTRWSNYIQNQVTITDLELRFEVGTPGQFTIAIDRAEMDLTSDPTDAIKKLVPNALNMELCYLLPGSYDWNVAPVEAQDSIGAEINEATVGLPSHVQDLIWASQPQVASYEERTFSDPLTASEAADDSTLIPPFHYQETEGNSTSSTELDPCDTAASGEPC